MTKDILLVIDNSTLADPMILASVAMAERLACDLTIEILSPSPVLIPALSPLTTMYSPESELARDEAARVETVSAMVASSPAHARVVGLHDDMSLLARRSGQAGPIADLIVIGDADLWDTPWLRRRTIETIIMGGGTPLLILSGATSLAPIHHAAIGWKDTAEARRAVHDLVALVEPGARIAVVGIEPDDTGIAEFHYSARDVVRHLHRHGFEAEAHALLDNGRSDAEALEGFALRQGAELLAIGAFGHSRLREVVFGGVTRMLIERPRLPLLLAR